MKNLLILVILASGLFSHESWAQFRCKGRLINGSYSKLDVANYCGSPLLTDSYIKTGTVNTDRGETTAISCESVDQWYYHYAGNQKTYIIEFERGFVSRIRQGRDSP